MTIALVCLWLAGAEAPVVCLDQQACDVRAAITNHQERRRVATCRRPAPLSNSNDTKEPA